LRASDRADIEMRMEPALASGTSLDEQVFRLVLALEVEKAARLRYYVSLVRLAADVPGSEIEPTAGEQIARTALHQLRRTDVGTVFADGTVALLLVDADPRALSSILDRAAGAARPGAWRFPVGTSTVSVSAGGSCYPATVTSGGELVGEATELMRRAQALGGDRLLLPPLLGASS
jgi:hypothetical protein